MKVCKQEAAGRDASRGLRGFTAPCPRRWPTRGCFFWGAGLGFLQPGFGQLQLSFWTSFWNGREGERAAVCAFAGCSLLSCSAAVQARGQGGVSFHEGLSSACFSVGFPHSGARS